MRRSHTSPRGAGNHPAIAAISRELEAMGCPYANDSAAWLQPGAARARLLDWLFARFDARFVAPEPAVEAMAATGQRQAAILAVIGIADDVATQLPFWAQLVELVALADTAEETVDQAWAQLQDLTKENIRALFATDCQLFDPRLAPLPARRRVQHIATVRADLAARVAALEARLAEAENELAQHGAQLASDPPPTICASQALAVAVHTGSQLMHDLVRTHAAALRSTE